jgi:type VI secretion system protein ImpC
MSPAEQKAAAAGATTTEAGKSLLDEAIAATKQTDRSRAEDMVKTLVAEFTKGTVSWDRNVSKTIKQGIEAIDAVISKQLAAIMHHPDFQKLEGTWRGLNYLVMNSETSAQLKLKVLNISKRDLFKDLDRAAEFDQSQVFKKLYENEFGSPGGEPYGALIGDYELENHPEDIDLLTKMSNVAAAAFCPFISAASHKLVGLDSFREDFRHRRIHPVALLPRFRGCAFCHPGHAARALAPALWREHQAHRGVQLRRSRTRQEGQGQEGPT